MVSVISASIIRQTFIPLVNYLKCFIYGTSKGPAKELRICNTDATENLEERKLLTGHEPCKPNNCQTNCQTTCQSTSFIKNSCMPRIYAEQSMYAACPDYTKTRLYSLPISKSLENPVTCQPPCNSFFGSCRWYSQQTEQNRLDIPIDLENLEKRVLPFTQFLGGCRWYSKKAGNDLVKNAVARMKTQGGTVEYSMGDNGDIHGFKEDDELKRHQE